MNDILFILGLGRSLNQDKGR